MRLAVASTVVLVLGAAAPADLGLEPVRIETPEGRAEYERLQRDFADRSQPLPATMTGA